MLSADLNQLVRRRNGIFLIFGLTGLGLANLIARLPAIRDLLEVGAQELGFFLFAGAAGAITGLLIASHVIAYLGVKRSIGIFGLLIFVAIGTIGFVGEATGSLVLTASFMILFGAGMSVTDVAMNVEGAEVERGLGRTIMPWYHAMFSLGTVAGGGTAALASWLGIGVRWHLLVTAVVLGAFVFVVISLLNHQHSDAQAAEAEPKSTLKERLSVWTDPRTILIGLVGLSMAFAEGSAGDWLAIGMVDDRGYTNAHGALWYVLFVAAMTVGRVVGVPLLDRYGRVPVLLASSLSAFIGLVAVIVSDLPVVAGIAIVLWGLGTALGFPVAMSAAADGGPGSTARVSAVATVAYGAFLIGPPLIGWIAEYVGVLNALWSVAALVALGMFAVPATKEQKA